MVGKRQGIGSAGPRPAFLGRHGWDVETKGRKISFRPFALFRLPALLVYYDRLAVVYLLRPVLTSESHLCFLRINNCPI